MGGKQTGGQRKQHRDTKPEDKDMYTDTAQPGYVFVVQESASASETTRYFRITKCTDADYSSGAGAKLAYINKGNHRTLSIPTMTIDGEDKPCSFHVSDTQAKKNDVISDIASQLSSSTTTLSRNWYSYSTSNDPMSTVMSIVQTKCT